MNNDNLKAGATAVALAVLLGVAIGVLSPGPNAGQGHVQVGTPAPQSMVVEFTALVNPTTTSLTGFDAGGLPVYIYGKVCATPVDGGVDPGGYAIPGAFVVWSEPTATPCDAGSYALEYRTQGDPLAAFDCACTHGDAGCWWSPPLYPSGRGDAGVAPKGQTLAAGTWSGSCIRKPCVELSGVSSWPAECPLAY